MTTEYAAMVVRHRRVKVRAVDGERAAQRNDLAITQPYIGCGAAGETDGSARKASDAGDYKSRRRATAVHQRFQGTPQIGARCKA